MIIELPVVRERPEDFHGIEEEIRRFFRTELYLPLLDLLDLGPEIFLNSREDLVQAILSGRITYSAGKFSGRLTASISRALKQLGAEWDRTTGAFLLPLSQIPPDLKNAISISESRFRSVISKLSKRLSEVAPAEIAGKIRLHQLFDTVVWKTDKRVEDSFKDLIVKPQLSEKAAKRISAEYAENLQLSIKDFTEKETLALRERIQAHIGVGGRREALVDEIRQSYAVSEGKAKFLARQETSLLMSKFKQVRYEEAGSREYRWRCVVGSPAHPVRPYHKKNDGKIFAWNDPPVVDAQGHRKHPGQDYNCRCTAAAIIRF